MTAAWSFSLAWALVGLLAGLVLKPTAACWLRGDKHGLADVLAPTTTAVAFGLVAARFTATLELVAVSVFVAVAVQLAVIDARIQRLPRALIWPTWIIVTCVFAAETVTDGEKTADLARALAGSAVLVVFYVMIALASRGGIGAGDVRMAALVGCVLGWHSWPAVASGTLLAFVAVGVIIIAFKHRGRSVVPFGPAMVLGTLAALLLP